MSGMISSCMFSTTPPVAKRTETTGMTSRSRPLSARTMDVTPRRSAPVSSTTVNAPPIRKAARERDDRVEEAHRARIDLMVGARHHDAPAGRLVVTAVELARRQHMARDGREDHAAGQQDEGVGDAELHRRR